MSTWDESLCSARTKHSQATSHESASNARLPCTLVCLYCRKGKDAVVSFVFLNLRPPKTMLSEPPKVQQGKRRELQPPTCGTPTGLKNQLRTSLHLLKPSSGPSEVMAVWTLLSPNNVCPAAGGASRGGASHGTPAGEARGGIYFSFPPPPSTIQQSFPHPHQK